MKKTFAILLLTLFVTNANGQEPKFRPLKETDLPIELGRSMEANTTISTMISVTVENDTLSIPAKIKFIKIDGEVFQIVRKVELTKIVTQIPDLGGHIWHPRMEFYNQPLITYP